MAREARPHRTVHAERLPEQRALDRVPAAPRGETFRGDPGVPEDGTDPSVYNFGPRRRLRVGHHRRRQDQPARRRRRASTTSIATANRAMAPSTRRHGTCVCRSRARPARSPIRIVDGRDFNLITDATIGTQQALFPKPVLIETLDEHYKTPVTYNFNLTFEREVMQGIMARAAYVGSRNRNGRFIVSLNPAIATIPGATTGNTDARRQFAADGIGIVNLQVQDRRSNYNGMQLTLSKRYSHGFQVSSNYTLSKVEGDFAGERQLTGGEIIPYFMFQDPALMWGPLDQDHRHRFTTSWVMDLPGQNLSGPLRWVIGGWQWSGVMQYQTGRPFTVTSGTDNSLDGIGNDRAKLTGADFNAVPTTPCANCVWYFNPAAFATNDLGTFGNVGKGAYYGPSLHVWDMGRVQELPLQQLVVRAGPSGVLQHLQPGEPRHPEHGRQQPGDARPDHPHRSELGRSAHSPVRVEVRILTEPCSWRLGELVTW